MQTEAGSRMEAYNYATVFILPTKSRGKSEETRVRNPVIGISYLHSSGHRLGMSAGVSVGRPKSGGLLASAKKKRGLTGLNSLLN